MLHWDTPLKPTELAETRLISAILDQHFPINSLLPPERELAERLGVTRPTLREALQRLAKDGWVEIHQGKPTRVRDFWREGNLGVLNALAHHPSHLPDNFITDLLTVRLAMAPDYTALAIQCAPETVMPLLADIITIPDTPEAFTLADWSLHYQLTIASGNPIYTLILNGFADLYRTLGCMYFKTIQPRTYSRGFYQDLYTAFQRKDVNAGREITRKVMLESIEFWRTSNLNTI